MNPITPQPQHSRFQRFWHFTKERPWAMSLCLHGVFFSLLIVSAIISWFNFPKAVHVFTLVDSSMMDATQGQPGPQLANNQKAAAIAAALEELEDDFLPELPPVKKEKPKPAEPKSEPKKVEAKVEKKPEQKIEKKEVVQTPKKDDLVIPDKKKVEPKKETEKKMTYEDFLKQNPKLDPKVKSQKDVKTTEKPKSSSSSVQKEIRQQLEKLKSEIKSISARSTISAVGGSASVSSSVGSSGGGGGSMMLSAMERYLSSLKGAIDRAWKKPESVSSKNAAATVEFQLDAQGRLGAVKLIKKSGDKTFDDSVLAAFESLGKSMAPAGTPPSKQSGAFRLTFQVE